MIGWKPQSGDRAKDSKNLGSSERLFRLRNVLLQPCFFLPKPPQIPSNKTLYPKTIRNTKNSATLLVCRAASCPRDPASAPDVVVSQGSAVDIFAKAELQKSRPVCTTFQATHCPATVSVSIFFGAMPENTFPVSTEPKKTICFA